jgi:putative aminopeptidase FrvX
MSTALKETLQRLVEAVGVSGDERTVRKLILEAIKDRVEQVIIDPMGNVTAVRKGSGRSALRVMVTAHMDEPGFMVTEVGENGMLHVAGVGMHDARFVVAQRVLVGLDRTPGAFLWAPIHFSHGRSEIVKIDDMQIDIGAEGKNGVKIKPGDRAAFMGAFAELGQEIIRAKALDSRAGCAALIALLEGDPFPFDLHVAFTAQETIGGRGAMVAAHRINPNAAFVLRGAECNDLPTEPDADRAPVVRLGAGPALTVIDPSLIADRRLTAHLQATARQHSIPCQVDAQNTARSEGGPLSLAREGIPTAVIAYPVRYLRSPNGLLNLNDLEDTVRLLRESLSALAPELLER